ncbi:MAG TPA: HNH endonuclease signature motif containing protein [Gaiellales bacterium]|nr:HNH endonuclease signature motif containing protein [Gaiellales bacterium]
MPESEKDAVYARYGVPHVPYQHEVDHLVSLEIGGSNAISNLWPEPYAGRWGARTKDVLEDRLHDLVCSGTIGLRYAQRIEARNWVAAYKRYVGSPPIATSSGSGGSGSSGVVSPSGGGNCTPGYSPCLPYRGSADYDCYGGGGNGPYFTAPGVTYTVTGSDPYRLDGNGNGDGKACS